MTCPACGEALTGGATHCASCGTLVAPPLEGALAPDPAVSRSKTQPLREIPGARKREPTWKDEVRERVRHRRRERTGGELPLFPDEQDVVGDAGPGTSAEARAAAGAAEPALVELGEDPLDLPLRDTPHDPPGVPAAAPPEPGRFAELPAEDEARFAGELPPIPRLETLPPVERPARPLERVQAAVLDLGLLLSLWAVVVYFATRAAHTSLSGLAPAWPWLVAYLAGLGLAYAVYFTGVTGQTLGKLALGLRVVTTGGQPPGPGRALGRAVAGVLGIAAVFLGLLPVLFDPAKRALHDRLLRTRVVKG